MELRRAALKRFDAAAFTADAQLDGSVPTWLTGIRINRAIPEDELVAERSCIIAFAADPSDPDEAVILAVYT